MIYLAYDIVLEADAAGFDIVAPIHASGRRIDAWTIRTVDDTTLPKRPGVSWRSKSIRSPPTIPRG